jgi:hypothetical protein
MGDYLNEMNQKKIGDEKVKAALKDLKDLHRNPLIHPEHSLESADEAIVLSELSFSLLHVALALSSGRSRPSSRSRRKRRPIASHCRSSRNHSRSRSTDHQTRTRRNCGCGTYGGNGHGSGHGPMQCAHSTPEHVRRSPVLCSSGRRASRGPHFHHASPWVQDHHHGNGLLNKGGGRRR